jgi:hypothetical protein
MHLALTGLLVWNSDDGKVRYPTKLILSPDPQRNPGLSLG